METMLWGSLNLWSIIQVVLELQIKNTKQVEISCEEVRQKLGLKELKSLKIGNLYLLTFCEIITIAWS